MRLLKKLDSWVRDVSHCFLDFLEDRLAPITLVALIAVPILSILSWDSWSNGESSGTAIRNLALVIAAIAALPLAIWRSKVAERQADTAQLGLLNERYQRSAEMLGNPDMQSVRLGGIYALERLAAERPNDYHVQIMRLFGAFVVDQTKSEVSRRTGVEGECDSSGEEPVQQRAEPGLALDVQEVMRLIAQRDEKQIALEYKEGLRLNLSHSSLVGLTLVNANLSNVDFTKANLSLVRLWQGRFSGAMLPGTNLTRASLVGADLRDTDMRRVNLSGADLIGANLRNADLGLVDLASEHLWGMELFPANLSGANLRAADLSGANMVKADLIRAKLGGATLVQVDLSNANLSEADLRAANLSGANLTGTNFGGVGADLSGAKLINCKGLTQEQINKAKADSDNPPDLKGTIDANTGNLLVWAR